jgi:endonuclease III
MSDFYFQFFDNERVTVILGFNKNVIAVDTTVGRSSKESTKMDWYTTVFHTNFNFNLKINWWKATGNPRQ